MYALRLVGLPFAVPFGENTRYDLVVEAGSTFRRVQCKTGRFRRGAVEFAICSSYAHHQTHRMATLRVEPPRNNQYVKVRLAAQYELVRLDVL